MPKTSQKTRYNQRSSPRRMKPPLESETRKNSHILYTKLCKEMEAEIRVQNNGHIYCFFTGLEIPGRVSWHHAHGRGRYYLDRRYLVPSINKYHLQYTHTPVEILSKEPWYYKVFLPNLLELSEELYYKEQKKFEKAGIPFMGNNI